MLSRSAAVSSSAGTAMTEKVDDLLSEKVTKEVSKVSLELVNSKFTVIKAIS